MMTSFDRTDVELFDAPTAAGVAAVDVEEAEYITRRCFGIRVDAERLTGERDENFRMRTKQGAEFVLKVANPNESAATYDLIAAALLHLERVDPTLPVPRMCPDENGRMQVHFVDRCGQQRLAMLCTFLPGVPLISATRSPAQWSSCGQLLARMGRALRSFEHAASHRLLAWDLRQLPRAVKLLPHILELPFREFITRFIHRFTVDIAPRVALLRRQFVHNDFNARNIIVDATDTSRVSGIIDFGDALNTALIADVAVGVIGQLATPETADQAVGEFVHAYCVIEPLSSEELQLLNWMVAGRIVQNIVLISWHRTRQAEDKHFSTFDTTFFEWRVELAKRLISAPPII